MNYNQVKRKELNIPFLILKTERKAGLNQGDLSKRDQRLKKRIGSVQVSEIRRALIFIAKQNTNLTYQELAQLIGFKGHSIALKTYRNAQNYYRQGDDKFRKALELVVKN